MICRHQAQNQKENKCHDYFIRHQSITRLGLQKVSTGQRRRIEKHSARDIVTCRLSEWKSKKAICPYDCNIKSCSQKEQGQSDLDKFNQKQKTLNS